MQYPIKICSFSVLYTLTRNQTKPFSFTSSIEQSGSLSQTLWLTAIFLSLFLYIIIKTKQCMSSSMSTAHMRGRRQHFIQISTANL